MKSQKVIDELNQEIYELKVKIDDLNETRRPWPMYDQVIGSPQDRLQTRKEILEILRDTELSINY